MTENDTPTPEQQVEEQVLRSLQWGDWVLSHVQVIEASAQSISLLNKITGETLILTAQAVRPKHSCYSEGSYNCGGCIWERKGPPPVTLSILRGYRA